MIRFIRWIRANGGWRFFVRLLFQGYHGGAAAAAGAGPFGWPWGAAAGQRAGQPGAGRTGGGRRRVTVEEVAEALSKLPTEAYLTPREMAALSVHELKALLHGRGLEPVKCLEKGDLVRQLLEHGGSSADSCSICCEEYGPQAAEAAAEPARQAAAGAKAGCGGCGTVDGVADAAPRSGARGASQGASEARPEAGTGSPCGVGYGGGRAGENGAPASSSCNAAGARACGAAAAADDDTPVVLRVLRCGHRFHVECVDKWFLSATDYTREPACPLCNAPLIPQRQ
ncbi:hypothetical protein HXX76_008575 [Chlamydomonas incerta]|uniref:RING-type domain-containing protein n=1 Tax=Chlamydomonas incerta TaxID=51695 RepID=A0A835SWM6_CHLIN|nr:hypothetical protein HXX76_008575 [Chlamydomonas incerta]|eukprot:KAG2432842.1 hypothetical protein HXX76_008575 [Chlamydomonas incerta]